VYETNAGSGPMGLKVYIGLLQHGGPSEHAETGPEKRRRKDAENLRASLGLKKKNILYENLDTLFSAPFFIYGESQKKKKDYRRTATCPAKKEKSIVFGVRPRRVLSPAETGSEPSGTSVNLGKVYGIRALSKLV
jgi:hypothetical protein